MNARTALQNLLPAWEAFRSATDIAPIRNEKHYKKLVAMLEALLDETAGDERHPAMGLVDIVGDLIEAYEAEYHPLTPATGLQALKFLMDQHGLKQGDLAEIGSQGVVSEILAGKRELNIRQVRALSRRFWGSCGDVCLKGKTNGAATAAKIYYLLFTILPKIKRKYSEKIRRASNRRPGCFCRFGYGCPPN